ncbi:cupredoxin domain-containing protein [Laceyella putida]|uniref:Cupredoxin domain-containing protein n=1 Tax=Laceyella putida TaxID=110101 RepID=A0ABW2RLY9_9BACL
MFAVLGGMVLGLGCGYLLFITYRYRRQLSNHVGMMVAMGGATMVGLLSGTILGTLFGGGMFLPTEIAMVFSLSMGYLLGKPFSLLAAIDGIVAGIMGGMMGVMLGVMVLEEAPDLTIGLMATLFVAVSLLLGQLMGREAKRMGDGGMESWILWGFAILMVTALVWKQAGLLSQAETPPNHAHPHQHSQDPARTVSAVQKTDHQVAQMHVTATGWSPDMIQAKAGIPLQLQVTAESESACGRSLLIEEFQIEKPVVKGTTTVEFTPVHEGTYPVRCGTRMGWLLIE